MARLTRMVEAIGLSARLALRLRHDTCRNSAVQVVRRQDGTEQRRVVGEIAPLQLGEDQDRGCVSSLHKDLVRPWLTRPAVIQRYPMWAQRRAQQVYFAVVGTLHPHWDPSTVFPVNILAALTVLHSYSKVHLLPLQLHLWMAS